MRDGKIYHGKLGSAELGHQVLFETEPACDMEHRGCLESLSLGTAIEREAGETAERVFERMRAGDRKASEIIERAARFIAKGLAKLDADYHPQVIVLGGGMSQLREYSSLIVETIEDPLLRSKVRIAKLGEKSGLLGAGRLALLGLRSNRVTE